MVADERSIVAGEKSIIAGEKSIIAGGRSIVAGGRSMIAGAGSIVAGMECLDKFSMIMVSVVHIRLAIGQFDRILMDER